VVLFDEVEKAHPDILNILLQVLEDGRLTDTQKRLIPFDNTIIIMTSNAGSEEIQELLKHDVDSKSNNEKNNETDEVLEEDEILEVIEKRTREKEFKSAIQFLESPIQINYLEDLKEQLRLEFEKSFRNVKDYKFLEKEFRKSNNLPPQKENDTEVVKNLKDVVLKKLSNLFLPEFLNRLDDIIIFKPLRPEELRKICEIMINEISKRVMSKKINLIVDENVKLKLSRDGYNPAFGARPLRRLITKNVEDLISEYLLEQMSNPITANNNKIRDLRISLNENDKIIINNIQRKL
jgi:ATP-dependent Clp protease ATP-binding subunit ClpA